MAAALLAAAPATAQDAAQQPLRLMALFSDHMVLPQSAEVSVVGTAVPGAALELAAPWLERPVRGQAGAAGRFELPLPTPAAGGPHEFTVRSEAADGSAAAEVVVRDVLVGDVWLGSGQSNMEMPVGATRGWRPGCVDWEDEVRDADLPQLRLFRVEHRTAEVPCDDVAGSWQVCTPGAAAEFSATMFFFGRPLQRQLEQPLGLVMSCWGGTVCEAWTRAPALEAFPEFEADLREVAAVARGEDPAGEGRAAFWRAVAAADPRVGGRSPMDNGFDDAAWSAVAQPHVWSTDPALQRHDGVGWYRCTLEVPAEWEGRELVLALGAIDDMDTVWFAGERVGGREAGGRWQEAREYAISGRLVKAGSCPLAVRVVDTGGEGGFRSSAEAMRVWPRGGEAGAIGLAQGWRFQVGVAAGDLPRLPRDPRGQPNRPSVLWNGMVAPLVPFPFRGVLWYQGESNRTRAEQYARLFPTMIGDWRAAFGRELPFLFVQIAPFGYGGDTGELFRLRLAQEAALELAATGMAPSTDVGDPADIHPGAKRAIGERLCALALQVAYGRREVRCAPPRPIAAVAATDGVRLRFRDTAGGLRAASGGPSHFELAGADGVFHPALAHVDGHVVLLRSDAVSVPEHVRYCHAASAMGDLWNGDGWPAVPFLLQVAR